MGLKYLSADLQFTEVKSHRAELLWNQNVDKAREPEASLLNSIYIICSCWLGVPSQKVVGPSAGSIFPAILQYRPHFQVLLYKPKPGKSISLTHIITTKVWNWVEEKITHNDCQRRPLKITFKAAAPRWPQVSKRRKRLFLSHESLWWFITFYIYRSSPKKGNKP